MKLAQVAWSPGTQFSRYEIVSRLARGGMAEVWRAAVTGLAGFHREVVIKTMRPELAISDDLVGMFINEARIAARLNHPGIMQVFDFGQLDSRYFIAMEYVPGRTLRQLARALRVTGHRVPRHFLLRLLTETARALGYGHTLTEGGSPLGFAHRDVSPENIMVSIDGTAKLIDFGAAVTRACPPPPRTFVGKYRYLAPERLRGADGDARADVYSLGIVLYEYVTGRRPYDGPHIKTLILEGAAPDPCRLVPTLPRRLGGLITKAIAVEPGKRFCNGSEFAEELALLLDHRDLGDVAAAATELEVLELLRSSYAEAERLTSPITEPGQDRFTVPLAEMHVVVPTVATVAAAGGAVVAVMVNDPLDSDGDLDADLDSFKRTDSEPRPSNESDDASLRADERSPSPAPPREPDVRVPDDDTLALSQGAPRRADDTAADAADSASSCFERGLALVAQHQFHAAVALWRRATTLDPQRRSYRTNLERLEKHIAVGRMPAKGPSFRNPPGRS